MSWTGDDLRAVMSTGAGRKLLRAVFDRRDQLANSQYAVERIVFDFKDDYTEVEVWCSAPSDGTLGVQGRHKATFPKDVSALDILTGPIARGEYLTSTDWA